MKMPPLLATVALGILASTAMAQDASEIVAEMQRRQAARYADVDHYLKVESMGDIRYATYFEKVEVDGGVTFRRVPFSEMASQTDATSEPGRAESIQTMSASHDRMEEHMAEQARQGMARVMSPQQLGSPMASFMGQDFDPENQDAEARAEAEAMADFIERAEVVGTEEVGGRSGFHLRATDLDDVELPDQGEFEGTLDAIDLWVDTEEYVPLRMTIEFLVEQDGRELPFTIEKLDEDYRQVGPLYEPYRTIMRISGIREAMGEEFAEMERQLEEMPANMRAMVEAQFSDLMGMSAFDSMVEVVEIQVNEDIPDAETMRGLLGRPGGP